MNAVLDYSQTYLMRVGDMAKFPGDERMWVIAKIDDDDTVHLMRGMELLTLPMEAFNFNAIHRVRLDWQTCPMNEKRL